MWLHGQTRPLEKCEQHDLKHPQAMLQNDICPRNSLRGGGGGFRLLAHGLVGLKNFSFFERAKIGAVHQCCARPNFRAAKKCVVTFWDGCGGMTGFPFK